MEQICAQLWYVELYFPRVPLIENVQVPENLLLVLASVQGHDKGKYLILFMRHVVALLGLFLPG